MHDTLTVNDAEYAVIKLLGKGKGGYSYLVTDGEREYNTSDALVCSLSDKFLHFSCTTTTAGGGCFAKRAGAFLQIFLSLLTTTVF